MASIKLGLVTTLIGMGVIFAVLAVLALVTILVVKIVDGNGAKQAAPAAPKAAPAKAPAAVPAPAKSEGIDAKVVAAITAAITVATGIPAADLKFTAIRRVSGPSLPWAQTGAIDIMNNRQRFTEGGNR